MRLAQKYTGYINLMFSDPNLQNNLGFSLYTVPYICCIVTTSDKWMKSEMGVSTDLMYCC